MTVEHTNEGVTVTLPAQPSRGTPMLVMGVVLALASFIAVLEVSSPDETEAPLEPMAIVYFVLVTLFFCGLAYVLLDQGLARRLPVTVRIDPANRVVHLPTYPAWGERPNGAIAVSLDDIEGVVARETGLKGVTRGKVYVRRKSDAPSVELPGYAYVPMGVLEAFARELEAELDRAAQT